MFTHHGQSVDFAGLLVVLPMKDLPAESFAVSPTWFKPLDTVLLVAP